MSIDVDGNGEPARDTTGDGLLNNVNGDENFSVFDVQALFEGLNTQLLQDNAFFFNFVGINEDRVSVFDVQALFTSVQTTGLQSQPTDSQAVSSSSRAVRIR